MPQRRSAGSSRHRCQRRRLTTIQQIRSTAARIGGSIVTVTSRSAVCRQLPTNVRIAASSDFVRVITVLPKRARVLCKRSGLIFYPFESLTLLQSLRDPPGPFETTPSRNPKKFEISGDRPGVALRQEEQRRPSSLRNDS